MRVVGEITHPQCKITIFLWNNRYLIKLENGLLEQTFKINEYDIMREADLPALLDEPFIAECLNRFQNMAKSLEDALLRLDDRPSE
ncbi:MAG TPA: hypothetical protein VD884_23300 [Ohtaekwangia sp.]|nr:hypothetical protein [Ohtaekwangia sp.]